jgi:hypothetical protein
MHSILISVFTRAEKRTPPGGSVSFSGNDYAAQERIRPYAQREIEIVRLGITQPIAIADAKFRTPVTYDCGKPEKQHLSRPAIPTT